MSDTAIAIPTTREIEANTVDILFNLTPIKYDTPIRAKALVLLSGNIALSKIEAETDKDSPWAIQDSDSREEKARKTWMLLIETQLRALKTIRELALITQQAEMLVGMELAKHEGYIGPDETYISIEDAYDSTDPDDKSYDRSGRARSIRAFIMKGTRILKEYGIPEERIIRLGRVRSSLADYYAWIKRIVRMDLDHKETTEALEHLVDVALSSNGPEFQKRMRVRYEETGGEDLGRGMYATANAGDIVHVALELPELLWRMIVQPRTRDVLDIAPAGTIVPAISPAMVEQALSIGHEWSQSEQRLMRAAIAANPYRDVCLGIMKAWSNTEVTIRSILSVTTLTSHQVRAAMVELCTYHRDGITTFCRLSRVDGDEQYWVLNRRQP